MPGPTWIEKLSAPFPPDKVMGKPEVVYCKDCREAQARVCNAHEKKLCPSCKQRITTAHIDLDYVGHADVTERLNQVDPRWSWRPAFTDPDPELLKLAIATGNAEVVQTVIANGQPRTDNYGGMWMYLTIHDDRGIEVTRLCYGDMGRNSGANGIKERIGDGIRNGAMRFGVALSLWSKAEAQATDAEALDTRDEPEGEKAPGTTKRERQAKSPAQKEAERLAKLAANIVYEGSTMEILKEVVYNIALKQHLFRVEVQNPFHKQPQIMPLIAVLDLAKTHIQERDDNAADGADAPADAAPDRALHAVAEDSGGTQGKR